ncbi:zinc-binding protein [Cryobacterium roopkundense]|uniref:SEC-C motif-containing protein n=1 Tax=Cryobacterium roopkundense TaxID=1001240 RepID=A0A099J813_9MICO|nr:YchJ family metal-binding protein [Cryobacterium roopkundense]KGJ74235.1 zinc-binding protein [Cryobacterium roopkundense]MBB5641461.1 SEC-C motif-containing protein [Cryobacterium roopkundense]
MASSLPSRCPCLSGDTYAACCQRYHSGDAMAPTAELLMRSRYSAFAVGDSAHLLATWHPQTRPGSLELDAEAVWTRLDQGGPFDNEGVVEFTAYSRIAGERVRQHETSRFIRLGRAWLYVDGVE